MSTFSDIKTNLGIVICLDERQENLSELLEKFPMLYNDAHMLWLDKWSHDTLNDMPALVIQRYKGGLEISLVAQKVHVSALLVAHDCTKPRISAY